MGNLLYWDENAIPYNRTKEGYLSSRKCVYFYKNVILEWGVTYIGIKCDTRVQK